ncbi:putative porin [Elongatibacter sediminis]|uniref:Porin n=1 Tax=Elongatibacter sediminis TaxID=3119006 RepID=A0AAW9RJ94_9GAMM
MKHLATPLGWLLASILSCAPALALADTGQSEIQLLREQIRALSARLDALEQGTNRNTAAPATRVRAAHDTASGSADDAPGSDLADLDHRIDQAVEARVADRLEALAWAERIRWSGDFRYRYENIDRQGQDERNRNRIRARAALQARVSDTVRVGLGLASGSQDPVSTNQTLGMAGSHKSLNIDLAYFEWTGLTNTAIFGGKYKNPLKRVGSSALVWDGDWRPEGFAAAYEDGSVFAYGLGTWLESDSASGQQEFSYLLQGGTRLRLGNKAELMLGAGYYAVDAADKGSFFGDGDFFGNSFDAATQSYRYDYRMVEAFAELTLSTFDRPLTLFGDYVTNLDADDEDSGYSLGFEYGEAKTPGAWSVGYLYKKLEADAVLGLLADSDFGRGGTDAKGHVLSGAYAIQDRWIFELTYFINKTGLASGDPQDQDRLQLNLNFKYR